LCVCQFRCHSRFFGASGSSVVIEREIRSVRSVIVRTQQSRVEIGASGICSVDRGIGSVVSCVDVMEGDSCRVCTIIVEVGVHIYCVVRRISRVNWSTEDWWTWVYCIVSIKLLSTRTKIRLV